MTIINAAAIQFNVKQGDVEANLAYVREALARAAVQGANLGVLPEMWSRGFAYKNLNELALRTQGIVDEILGLSKELKLVIVGSMPEPNGDNPSAKIKQVASGRFGVTTGSAVWSGKLDQPAADELTDHAGVLLGAARQEMAGMVTGPVDPGQFTCFIEMHIEQGPVLDGLDTPLGIVTSINGAKRFSCEAIGTACHAFSIDYTPDTSLRDAPAPAPLNGATVSPWCSLRYVKSCA